MTNSILIFILAVGFIYSIPLMVRQSQINRGKRTAPKGSRFTKLVKFSGDFEKITNIIDDFLTANGFHKQSYGDETIYRRGSGMIASSQFFKFSRVQEGIFIEAFVIFFREMNLDGFVGIAVKVPLKKIVDKIIVMIETNEIDT
ncbi:MAG: hypothetical protein FWH15_06635 [Betaproteobacteria bacterium]|nr:hypothetical protein [Betaproteobacteria bacterium]